VGIEFDILFIRFNDKRGQELLFNPVEKREEEIK
jgi:hypothetical protein